MKTILKRGLFIKIYEKICDFIKFFLCNFVVSSSFLLSFQRFNFTDDVCGWNPTDIRSRRPRKIIWNSFSQKFKMNILVFKWTIICNTNILIVVIHACIILARDNIIQGNSSFRFTKLKIGMVWISRDSFQLKFVCTSWYDTVIGSCTRNSWGWFVTFFKIYQFGMLFDIFCRNINETDTRDVFFTPIEHFIWWSDCFSRYHLQTSTSDKTLHSATDVITRTFSMTNSKKISLIIHSKVSFVIRKVAKFLWFYIGSLHHR